MQVRVYDKVRGRDMITGWVYHRPVRGILESRLFLGSGLEVTVPDTLILRNVTPPCQRSRPSIGVLAPTDNAETDSLCRERYGIGHRLGAEVREAVEGQVVGVVGVVGAALAVVVGRAAGGDDVLAVE